MGEVYCEQIRNAAQDHQVVVATTMDDAIREIPDTDVIFDLCPPKVFAHAKQLKWFQSSSAGQDNVLFPELIESDVIVTNAAGVYASHAAEHDFALLLGLTRGIHQFVENRRTRSWQNRPPIVEIGGWTLGIIGMGGFGMEMAKRGKGFGLRVIAVDAYRSDPPECVDALWNMDRFDDLLCESDIVMIACPLTSETHHLLDSRKLELMKPTAFLINVARGKIIDETALIETLKERKIAGAGLDVFEIEPLPSDNPLWELDNVILTPHVAGRSQHRPGRTVDLFCDNIRRYLSCQPLRNVVNKRKGF